MLLKRVHFYFVFAALSYVKVNAGGGGGDNVSSLLSPPAIIVQPPMGWNSWNAFGCDTTFITEKKIKTIIDAIVNSGISTAGYNYVNLDDCWLDKSMASIDMHHLAKNLTTIVTNRLNVPLQADPKRFTNGSLATLADYAHSKGLKFGTYLDAGRMTCGGYPGSYGFEEEDSKTLASWGIDYLKLDGCYTEELNTTLLYAKWSNSLKSTHRDIVFSCSYPAYIQDIDPKFPENFNWEYIQTICNLWRLYSDISPTWDSLLSIIDYWRIHQSVLRKYTRSNNFHDPDLLEIGNNGLTGAEARTQLSIWAMIGAPLILSFDITIMTEDVLTIITNPEFLSIHEDITIVQGLCITHTTNRSVWIKILKDQSIVVAVINLQNTVQYLFVTWLEITENASKWISITSINHPNCNIQFKNVWARLFFGSSTDRLTTFIRSPAAIPEHGTFLLRIYFSKDCFIQQSESLTTHLHSFEHSHINPLLDINVVNQCRRWQ